MDNVLKSGLAHVAEELEGHGVINYPKTCAIHVRQAIAAIEAGEAREAELRARVEELEGFCKTYVEAIQVLIDKKEEV